MKWRGTRDLHRDCERRERAWSISLQQRVCHLCPKHYPFSSSIRPDPPAHTVHLSRAHLGRLVPADSAKSQPKGSVAFTYRGLAFTAFWSGSPQDPIFTKLRAKSQQPAARGHDLPAHTSLRYPPRWPPSRMAQLLREFSMIAMWRRKPWSPTTRSRSSMRTGPNCPRSTP